MFVLSFLRVFCRHSCSFIHSFYLLISRILLIYFQSIYLLTFFCILLPVISSKVFNRVEKSGYPCCISISSLSGKAFSVSSLSIIFPLHFCRTLSQWVSSVLFFCFLFYFISIWQTVFQNGFTIMHFCQHYLRISVVPHSPALGIVSFKKIV